MKKGSVIGAFFFILFSFAVVLAQQTVITGKVLGSDAKPMIKANVVFLEEQKVGKRLNVIEVSKDGTFQFTTDKTGLFFLKFTGVNHFYKYVPLMLEGNSSNIKLNVQLESCHYRDDDKYMKLAVQGIPNLIGFQKQADGTYLAEVTTDKDRLEYQVINFEARAMYLPGTQSEDYVFDNRDSYRSVITVKDGKARIVFEPKKLVASDAKSKVEIESNNSHISESIKFQAELDTRFSDLYSFMQEKFKSGYKGEYEEALQDYYKQIAPKEAEAVAAIKARLGQEKDPFARQVLLVNYFTYNSVKPDPEIANTALNEISPSSMLWGVATSWHKNIFKASPIEKWDSYLNRVLAENKEVNTKANLLLSLIMVGVNAKNQEIIDKYYTILSRDYPNTIAAYTAKELPDVNNTK